MKALWIFSLVVPVLAQVPTEDPLAISEDMRAFVHDRVGHIKNPYLKVHRLVEAIFSENDLNLTYELYATQTAEDTFLKRAGNCLSFTNMFVAMAREAGFKTYFKEVNDIATWDRRQNVIFHHKHMVASVYIDGRLVDIDFYPFKEKEYRLTRVINDKRAMAHYYNNLGAEHYANGDIDTAEMFFNQAIALDDRLTQVVLNMGVMCNRRGDQQRAVQLYEQVLEEQPRNIPALTNLASLYKSHGRDDLANRMIKALDIYSNRNPYFYNMMGEQAFADGNFKEALDYFRKAVKLHPGEPLFYVGLGKTYHRMENRLAAEDAFADALSKAHERNEDFEARIAAVRDTLQ
ncbi:MAG: tetratricopeptide repeat protein [Acidobacteria bacterium]|nr:tetratricopeptide repeat protein [Acidobacteriota bacterium]